MSLDGAQRLPLGVFDGESYPQCVERLVPGDQIIFYTDGITEAANPAGEMFGVDGLDRVLADCRIDAGGLIRAVLAELEQFTGGLAPVDDQTLVVAKVN
jgi:sigma-B regulation protein RsbU (phosphoserine phosphatase)